MTLKECLAAMRAEKAVTFTEAASAGSEAVEGIEEQNRPVNPGIGGSSGEIHPRKPEDFDDQREIYPRSTRIYPSTPVKAVQSEIFFGEVQGEPKKIRGPRERVGALGEIRVDRGVLRVDRAGSHREIGEKWAKSEGAPAGAPVERSQRPFLTAAGDLRIPFGSDPKYHWWNGGQSVKETIAELKAERERAAEAAVG